MTLDWRQEADTVTYIAGGAIANGELILDGGLVAKALNAATNSGDEVEAIRKGGVHLAKATGFVPTAWSVAYWDVQNDRLAATGVPIGWYLQAALTGDTSAWVDLDPKGAQADVVYQPVDVYLVSGASNTKVGAFVAPFAGKIVGVDYYTTGKPTSSSGTALLTAQNAGVSDHTILDSATFDLKTMTENAVTAFTLTSTAADLVCAAGGVVEFICAANNNDIVGGQGVHFYVKFQRT